MHPKGCVQLLGCTSMLDNRIFFTPCNGISVFEPSKTGMPQKVLEKGDRVWGRGKEPFFKRFFPLPQRPPEPHSKLKNSEFGCEIKF